MKKAILFLMMTVLVSLTMSAETAAEAYRKHPDAVCVFLKTPASAGDLKGFDIERIAIYPDNPQKVYLKIVDRKKEVMKKISEKVQTEDDSIMLLFKDGSSLLMSIDDGCVMYFSTKEQAAIFRFDLDRQEEYLEIKKTLAD